MTVVLTNPYWKAVKSQSSTLLFYHPHASQLPYTINTRCTMIIIRRLEEDTLLLLAVKTCLSLDASSG